MITAVIIDDDKNLRKGLKSILQKHVPEITVMAEADSVESGFNAINSFSPQVVFLDIHLTEGTGFDILEKLMKSNGKINSHIIFITAHDQYAVKAFKFSALDYLLKPIDPEDLKMAINKIKFLLSEKNNSYNHLDLLLENIRKKVDNFKRIALSTAEGIHLFEIQDIIRCESNDNYTNFFIKGHKPLLISKTLKDYEVLLSQHGFERIHQSHLINITYLKSYIKSDGGYVVMSDGTQLPISQRKKERLQEIIKGL